ncbi:hypothetical protein LP422_02390 [Janibacter limosus]|nr:hypothetical protein LP422_02390 [Janibacter limosus]
MNALGGWTPSYEVAAQLTQRARAGTLPDITVLPSQRREGEDFYSESDSQALKVPHDAMTKIGFLDGEGDRRFLAEYSADVAMQLALAWSAELGSAGLLGLVKYVIQRARAAGLAGTLSDGAALEINVARITKSGDDIEIEGLQITAREDEVAKFLVRALASHDVANTVLEKLNE